jgi:hypothetical protein
VLGGIGAGHRGSTIPTGQNYWLDSFTGITWQEFLDAGAKVSGFRKGRWNTVQQIKPRDYLLCYLTGVSRFIGVLEVISEPYQDETTIWKDEVFPCRVKVEVVAALTPETAVPIFELKEQLTIFQNLKSPNAWTSHVRRSPTKWKASDGEAAVYAVMEAVENPVERPVDESKLARRPRALRAKGEYFTVPGTDDTELSLEEIVGEPTTPDRVSVQEVGDTSKEVTGLAPSSRTVCL